MKDEQRTQAITALSIAIAAQTDLIKTLLGLDTAVTVSGTPEPAPKAAPEAPSKPAKGRAKTAKAGTPAPEPEAPSAPNEHGAEPDAIPVTPAPVELTQADLRAALQGCIDRLGMDKAKERLAPHASLSRVPPAEFAEIIARLQAE